MFGGTILSRNNEHANGGAEQLQLLGTYLSIAVRYSSARLDGISANGYRVGARDLAAPGGLNAKVGARLLPDTNPLSQR